MLVSLKWLNEYVKVDDLDPQALADKISLHGVEIDAVNKVADATGVVVGYVKERIQHPDADKLSVCQVDLGMEVVQIVCGAPNVAAGQKVPVATNGAVLPGGFKIKKTKLRGQESNGMICSATELGLATNVIPDTFDDGIWVLPTDAPIGVDAITYLGLDDVVLELGLTPNRMDMLSMYGVANDVAAILDLEAKPVKKARVLHMEESDFSVTLETEKCTTYLAKIAKNVIVQPSSHDVQMRLMATGNKPINNIVDLTNEIMLTTGLPVHAFDADKLPSKDIVVRVAKDGEKTTTLDGEERELVAGDIVITSGDQVVAIAGIMGCANASVDENTKNVLFEAAIFNPLQVRQTASRLNLRTSASARFEKGIHVERVFEVSQLIDIAVGTTVNVTAGELESEPVAIEINTATINKKLGTNLTKNELQLIFDRLNVTNMWLTDEDIVLTPSTRMLDVTDKHDVIEEVARIYGFNNLTSTLPRINTVGGYNEVQKQRRTIHRVMQASGLSNVITYSLTKVENLQRFAHGDVEMDEVISLMSPMSNEHAHLRKSLLPELLEVLAHNGARGHGDVCVYEIGRVYDDADVIATETHKVSGAMMGKLTHNRWQNKVEAVDFYTAKGMVDALVESLGYIAEYRPFSSTLYKDFHPGQSALILVEGNLVGVVGKVHPQTAKSWDLDDVYVFEIDLEDLTEMPAKGIHYEPVSKFPGVEFDLAVVTDEHLLASKLVACIVNNGGSLVKSAEVFDVYQGVGVEEGKKSVAINVMVSDCEKTLSDEDIQPLRKKLLKKLEEECGAILRG